MKISPNSTHKHALIGNPFTAAINMKNFYDVNAGVLNNSGYYAYDNSGASVGTWKNYPYTTMNGVNSLQAFVVVFKTNAANQTLYFPLEEDYALTGTATNVIPRRMPLFGALSVSVNNEEGIGGDYAELNPLEAQNELKGDVRKLISGESYGTPEVFFLDGNKTSYNLMQIYKEGQTEVGLGIRCSDSESNLTLTFDHIDEFIRLTDTKPVLVDKLLGVEQDLTKNKTYNFKQQAMSVNDGKYSDVNRFAIRLGDPSDLNTVVDDNLIISYQQGDLIVKSTSGIVNVKVYNLLGQLIFDSKILDGNENTYSRNLTLPEAYYIVKVNTANNKITNRKIAVIK